MVHGIERVGRCVEEEDIAQTQHQTRHSHRQHGQQAHQTVQQLHALGFFQQVGADKNQQGAKERRACGHLQAVEEGHTHFGIQQAELVVAPARAQVVGPERGKGGEHRHAQHGQHQRGDGGAVQRHEAVVNG